MQDKAALPDLAQHSARLATSSVRVARFLDGLTLRVDQMIDRAGQDDWQSVAEMGRQVADESAAQGLHVIGQRAQQLAQASQKGGPRPGARRSLMRLIAAYGAARAREAGGPQDEPSSTR
jgi:hypothetical protein